MINFMFRYAFKNSILGNNLLTDISIIEKILAIFYNGAKTELVLNILLYTDFTRWE
jgi:hypothetical protein